MSSPPRYDEVDQLMPAVCDQLRTTGPGSRCGDRAHAFAWSKTRLLLRRALE